MKWKQALEQIRIMKHYLIAACLVMVISIFMGIVYHDSFQTLMESQLQHLQRLVDQVDQERVEWSMFWIIFWNNTKVALLIIAFGFFFGLFPLFTLVGNGLMIGYVGVAVSEKASWLFFVKSVLPHAVLELPAIIFASAVGLRLGALVIKMLFSFLNPRKFAQSLEQMRSFLYALVPICILIVGMMFVAAIIESTISYWLVQG